MAGPPEKDVRDEVNWNGGAPTKGMTHVSCTAAKDWLFAVTQRMKSDDLCSSETAGVNVSVTVSLSYPHQELDSLR